MTNGHVDIRLAALRAWVVKAFAQLGIDLATDWSLTPVSGDASFRRYFRVRSHNLSWIAVDAPPEKEDSRPFVAIARAWEPLAIQAPRVFLADFDDGFMLLSDLGDDLYLGALTADNADQLYAQALQALTHIQQCRSVADYPLPPYDAALLAREMDLFGDWFVTRLLGIVLTDAEAKVLAAAMARLQASALEQPRACVHRDFHSRNLMLTASDGPGVLDFQDAVLGPVTYDLVSLLRDCYIAWPESRVRDWALGYRRTLQEIHLLDAVDESTFLRWFDWMGMQRHMKAIGIFARLQLRDGKPAYLGDIPRTLNYLYRVALRYPQFSELAGILQELILPAMQASGHFDARALSEIGRADIVSTGSTGGAGL